MERSEKLLMRREGAVPDKFAKPLAMSRSTARGRSGMQSFVGQGQLRNNIHYLAADFNFHLVTGFDPGPAPYALWPDEFRF
jgi:hypothetical protein